jgi:hypothetical protein
MSDRSTAKRAKFALHDLLAGDVQPVATFLAHLAGIEPVPEVPYAIQREVPKALEVKRGTVPERTPDEMRAREQAGKRPVKGIPRPHRRHKEPDKVAEFRALFTQCCLLECPNGNADPHHIWERGAGGSGGSDDWSNLMPLCRGHHDDWSHLGGREGFVAKYGRRLSNTILLKIRLAAEMEAEAKLADRPAVDLDDAEIEHGT